MDVRRALAPEQRDAITAKVAVQLEETSALVKVRESVHAGAGLSQPLAEPRPDASDYAAALQRLLDRHGRIDKAECQLRRLAENFVLSEADHRAERVVRIEDRFQLEWPRGAQALDQPRRMGRARREVAIDVAYSGVNFADVQMRIGLYPDAPPLPYAPGYEVAGVATA